VDRHGAGGELDRLPRPGQRVRPAARDLDRAEGGRALLDRTAEAGKRRLDGRPGRDRAARRRQRPLEIVGRRRRPETGGRAIALAIAEVVLDEARRPAEEDRQDAAGERVERAAVADPFRAGQPSDQSDDVV
jgi:hypothetical protein